MWSSFVIVEMSKIVTYKFHFCAILDVIHFLEGEKSVAVVKITLKPRHKLVKTMPPIPVAIFDILILSPSVPVDSQLKQKSTELV